MNTNDIQRAALAMFAAREAGPGGCYEQMKAIAICMRNRVRQGWHGGDWLQVIERASENAANLPGVKPILQAENRDFQRIIRDIDEVYWNRTDWKKEPSRDPMPSLDEALGNACYWAFLNQPMTPWFREHVLDDPENHPQKTNMGLMMFYE